LNNSLILPTVSLDDFLRDFSIEGHVSLFSLFAVGCSPACPPFFLTDVFPVPFYFDYAGRDLLMLAGSIQSY